MFTQTHFCTHLTSKLTTYTYIYIQTREHCTRPCLQLYEEMLEEALDLKYGEWKELAHAASRGDTGAGLTKIAEKCAQQNADLSPWGQLLDVYGIFAVGMGALDTTLM